MRAAVCTDYGGPDVIEVRDVPTPDIGDADLLIRVVTSTVNRTTTEIRKCTPPWAVRPMYGFRRPRRPVLGTDVAGVVEAVGPDVRGFAVGDRVFGFNDRRMGAHAELMALGAAEAVAAIPDGVSFDDAVAGVEGAVYALTYIERADLEAGQRALVYGGGGAIGSTAVQLLAARDIEVVAVAEQHQIELMQRLGAAHVIDWRAGSFVDAARELPPFDLVFDAVGHTSFDECRPLVSAAGSFMATELGHRLDNLRKSVTTRFGDGPRVHFPLPVGVRRHVKTLATELEAGRFQPVVDSTYALDDVVDAHRRVDTAAKTGTVLLSVADAA